MQAFEKDNPPDFVGTELQLYISHDQGKSWEYRSSFAYGGWEQVDMLVSYDSRIHQAGCMGMAVIENDTKLIQLAPTQMDPVLLQISFGIASMETR